MTNTDRPAAIEARANAATEGPWMYYGDLAFEVCVADPEVDTQVFVAGRDGRLADSRFIAHAREDVPWLVEQVRILTAERDSARDWAVRLEQELAAAEATVQRVRGLADRWADPWESDGMSGNAWIGMALTAAAERLHHVLDGTAQPGTDAATEGGE